MTPSPIFVFYLAFTTTYRTFRYDCGFSIRRAIRFAYNIAKQGLVIDGIQPEEN